MKDYKPHISRTIDGNYAGTIWLGTEPAYVCESHTEQAVKDLIAEWLHKQEALPLLSAQLPQSSPSSVGNVPTTKYSGSLKQLMSAAIEVYRNSYSDHDLVIKNPRDGDRYIQMTFSDWPARVHYEFLTHQRENFLGVELHVETDKFPALKTEMPLLYKKLHGQFGPYKLEYYPNWDDNGCKLMVCVTEDATAEAVAETMNNLVGLTCNTINDKLGLSS